MTTSTGAQITPAADHLRRWLLKQSFAGLRPLDVRLDMEQSPTDEQTLYIDVVLATPPAGQTWPIDELFDMRRAVRDKALELGVGWPWHVRVRPETEEPEVPEPEPAPMTSP